MSKDIATSRANTSHLKVFKKPTILALIFFIVGLSAAVYLHWPALENYTTYKGDIRQSPHWAAYHKAPMHPNDLLLKYAKFNESPVQNTIYYVGTFFVDMVLLTKILAVVSYGLCALLFFCLGHALFGLRGGCLAAIFFTFFPDQFTYFVGGFSKAWMIPLILVCLYLLDKQNWLGITLLLPFAACAYPMAAVLIGMTTAIYLLLHFYRDFKQALPVIWKLIPGALCGVIILLVKYISPPEFIGEIRSKAELLTMPEMYRGGLNHYLPIPTIFEELLDHVYNPFVIGSAIFFFIILRKNVAWRRSWTALLIASIIGYLLSEWLFMKLYIPNRYTRYSIVVLLIMWHAQNWDLMLKKIPWKTLQIIALIAVLGIACHQYKDDFYQGKQTMNRKKVAPLCNFLSSLPGDVMIAAHPYIMDDIPIQARRSVLCNYKMAHPWFTTYYDEIRERTLKVFDALYASDTVPVNTLYKTYGITHLVVENKAYESKYLRRNVYVSPYNRYIRRLIKKNKHFLLANPPPGSIVYEDNRYTVLELPL